MSCPACGENPPGTIWQSDPLRWDMNPPCSEAEWTYLAGIPGAPEYLEQNKFAVYMNKICRGCYNERFIIKTKVKEKIRDQGGIEAKRPAKSEREDYERRAENLLRDRRPGRVHGLKSAAAAGMNGQLCRLVSLDDAVGRWTVELLSGEFKALKIGNIECSKEIDAAFEAATAGLEHQTPAAGTPAGGVSRSSTFGSRGTTGGSNSTSGQDSKRPLGSKTAWPKVKGIHPGAVVRLKDLQGAAELNGRKGRCISFDPEVGRWKVDLGDGYKNLKVDNLQPAPSEKAPTAESAEAEKQELAERAAKRSTLSAKERSSADYGWDAG